MFDIPDLPILNYTSIHNKNGLAILVSDDALNATNFKYRLNQRKILAYNQNKLIAEIPIDKVISDIINKRTFVVKVDVTGQPLSEHNLEF